MFQSAADLDDKVLGASGMNALRYGLYNALLIVTGMGFLLGKGRLWLGFVFLVAFAVIGKKALPLDLKSRQGTAIIVFQPFYSIACLGIPIIMRRFNCHFAN